MAPGRAVFVLELRTELPGWLQHLVGASCQLGGRSTWSGALSSQRRKGFGMTLFLSMSNQIKQYIHLHISNQINLKYRSFSSLRPSWVPSSSSELYLEHGKEPRICTTLLGFGSWLPDDSLCESKIQSFFCLPCHGSALLQIHWLEPVPASYPQIHPSQNFLCSVAQISLKFISLCIFGWIRNPVS